MGKIGISSKIEIFFERQDMTYNATYTAVAHGKETGSEPTNG